VFAFRIPPATVSESGGSFAELGATFKYCDEKRGTPPFMTIFATVRVGGSSRFSVQGTGMAKSRRSRADDTPNTSAARPQAGRRKADGQPKPTNGAPGSSADPSPETPDQYRRDLASPHTQDVPATPQIERDEPAPSEPSVHEIRLRAYHLFLDRGAFHGADFDDWLQAEMELKKR
jgi:hypothetical protein